MCDVAIGPYHAGYTHTPYTAYVIGICACLHFCYHTLRSEKSGCPTWGVEHGCEQLDKVLLPIRIYLLFTRRLSTPSQRFS